MTRLVLSKEKLLKGASVAGLMAGMWAVAMPAFAQDDDDGDVLVVKGFKSSIEAARDLKRDAVNQRDSIVAEDIGKFPDLNLAESIQRVPGVAIQREGGEGRKVSIRGLGPDFTRVTLNGMEVPASTGGLDSSGGVNRGRSFDFNVFSAELFNRIDIQKSPTASIEEGGVAGTIELYSARPLDNTGFNATLSGQIGYNDLTEANDPRYTAIISNTNAEGTAGFLLSAAYTERTVHQDGFGTVRWARPDRDFLDVTGATLNGAATDRAALQDLWYPRLPRQDSFRQDQKRLGLSGALQFQPNDRTEVGVNWLYSKFESDLDAYNSFAQFRRSGAFGYPAITPISVTSDSAGRVALAGSFDGVALRTESRQQIEETTFNQLTADFERQLTDNLTLTGMIGRAESEFEQDYFRANIQHLGGGEFSYDFTGDDDVAAITYGQSVTDPSNFEILTNDRIEIQNVDRTNTTARLDLEWELENSMWKFGFIGNDREVDSREDGPLNINDTPGNLQNISFVYNFEDIGGHGSATTTDFLVLDFAAARQAFNVGSYATVFGPGQPTWTVGEKTWGAYAEYTHMFDSVTANIGGRFVNTETEAVGYADSTGNVVIEVDSDYSEFLPAANLAWEANDNLLLRAGVSRSLTRAGLGSIAPNQTYTDVNFTVSGGNPTLTPQFSNNIDLSLEYYFGDTGLFSFAVFTKDIEDLIDSDSFSRGLTQGEQDIVSTLYPGQPALLGETWDFSLPGNTATASLDGFEVAFQRDFEFLPGILGNTGVIANYTYVDGETEDADGNKGPITGLSETSLNGTLYYEEPNGRYGGRVSVNQRDDFITRDPGRNGNAQEATTGPTRVDFAGFYNINETVTATFELINATNEAERLFTTGDGDLNLVREYNEAGRQFFVGVRASF